MLRRSSWNGDYGFRKGEAYEERGVYHICGHGIGCLLSNEGEIIGYLNFWNAKRMQGKLRNPPWLCEGNLNVMP